MYSIQNNRQVFLMDHKTMAPSVRLTIKFSFLKQQWTRPPNQHSKTNQLDYKHGTMSHSKNLQDKKGSKWFTLACFFYDSFEPLFSPAVAAVVVAEAVREAWSWTVNFFCSSFSLSNISWNVGRDCGSLKKKTPLVRIFHF